MVIDADFETSGTPIDELNVSFCLYGGDGVVDIFRDHVTSVQKTASHVLPLARITLDHLILRFETGCRDLVDGVLFVESLFSGKNRSIGRQREVYARVGNEIRLELGQVDIECSVKAQRSRDGADHLSNEPVQIAVGRPLDVQVATTNLENGFVVDHKGAVGMFQSRVGGEDRVVRLHDGSGHSRSWINGEFQFRFLGILDTQSFHEQRGKTGASSTSETVEDQKALKSGAVFCQLPDSLEDEVNQFFSDAVMSSGVVVGSIFFPIDQLFRVEKLLVSARPYFVLLEELVMMSF